MKLHENPMMRLLQFGSIHQNVNGDGGRTIGQTPNGYSLMTVNDLTIEYKLPGKGTVMVDPNKYGGRPVIRLDPNGDQGYGHVIVADNAGHRCQITQRLHHLVDIQQDGFAIPQFSLFKNKPGEPTTIIPGDENIPRKFTEAGGTGSAFLPIIEIVKD